MNALLSLNSNKINSLGYDSVYVEKPISKLIDFDWRKILQSPPLNSSQETFNELLLISKSTKNRKKKDIELVHRIDLDIDTPYELVLKKYRLKYPKNYINLFYDIIRPVILNIKGYWNRPRPKQLAELYNIDIDVIITDTHHTAAYPSGHVVYSSLVSQIIKDIYPQVNQKELDYIVSKTAEARVLQGVHYPSDNQASIIFSRYMFDKLNAKLRKYQSEKI
jgi:hypothetical protein